MAALAARDRKRDAASRTAAATGVTTERVSWPVEDPSEFRPELAPGGALEDLGKDSGDFRVYYEVCARSADAGRIFATLCASPSVNFTSPLCFAAGER